MRIAVDIQPLTTGAATRGMGVYTLGLLKELFRVDRENEYFIFNFYGHNAFEGEDLPDNVHYESFYPGDHRYLLTRVMKQAGELEMKYGNIVKGMYQTFIRKNEIDVFFITSPFDDNMIYEKEWFDGTKIACIFYDLIPYIFQTKYIAEGPVRSFYLKTLKFIEQADRLLAISNSAKDDLINYLQFDENKISVIHSGISSTYCRKEYTQDERERGFSKYSIKGKYLLFPSGADFRKNAAGTIRAYGSLPRRLVDEYQLIITGTAPDDYVEAMGKICAENNLEDRVVFTRHIPYEDLLLLYNNAALILFPTLYEGFGLPVIEAFQCGKNVVTSNNSSLGEVAEGAAVLVDPFDVGDITRGLQEALTSTDFSIFEAAKQKKLEFYTWENSAQLTLRAFKTLAAEEQLAMPEEYTAKKIAFFTPLTPLQSGISDYSEIVIDHLCKHFDIDVFIDDGYTPGKKFAQNVNVFVHSVFETKKLEYDGIIYQMGNSEFHLYMFPYIAKHPGTVVLHDLNLHQVVYRIIGQQEQNWEEYQRILSYEVTEASKFMNLICQNPVLESQAINEVVVNRFVADFAKNLIVHSDYARVGLLEKNVGYKVKKVNLLMTNGFSQQGKAELRKKYKIPEDEIVLASFGAAALIKRILENLEAFEEVRKKYPQAKYYIVGNVIQPEIFDYIDEHSLREHVKILGFVEDLQVFEDYIAMSDICLNLRHPYFGETSGSLIRILAAGKPVIVTDIGSYSEMPGDCCIKIGYTKEREIPELTRALFRLLEDKEYARELGENARQFVEKEFDPEHIIKQYCDFVLEDAQIYLTDDDLVKIASDELLHIPEQVEEFEKVSRTLTYLMDEKLHGMGTHDVEIAPEDFCVVDVQKKIADALEHEGVSIERV